MLNKLRSTTDSWEDKLRGLLFLFRIPLFILCVTALSLVARLAFWPFVSEDFAVHLDIWLNEIRAMHGLHSIGSQVGNYTPPYHYLLALLTYIPGLDNLAVIKATSIGADYFMACGGALLAARFTQSKWKGAAAYCILLCLPTVFLNSAAWGQCDAMYAGIVLFALYFWARNNKVAAMGVYGLALAVKLQAIFVLPAFVVFWLCGRLRIRYFLAMAGAYVAAFIPAMMASGSLEPLVRAYGMQAIVHTLAPNIYNGMALFNGFSQEQVYLYSSAFVLFALLAVGLVAFYCWQQRSWFSENSEFLLVLLMACLVPYLMPGMRERYFFLAEVLAVVYALRWPRRLAVPLLLQLGTLPTYTYYLLGASNYFGNWLLVIMAVPCLVVFWDLYRHLSVQRQLSNNAAM